jgi:wyosine [tRNA(Phe)-imidazoG37] synthetase (radical SAM superfamily)
MHFHQTVFGPINSRRLGISLGINLLPTKYKFCTFNCIYCECGWTEVDPQETAQFVSAEETMVQLEKRLIELTAEGISPDSFTLAGNGEPTIHPEFPAIVDGCVKLRDQYFPKSKISVLSNASMLNNPEILAALKKVDNNIQKIDAGTEETFQLINQPKIPLTLREVVEDLKQFKGNFVVQTLFLRYKIGDVVIDNTTEEEITAWLSLLKEIRPRRVMLYSVERDTPMDGIEKVSKTELARIAARVEKMGMCAEFFD